MAESIESGSTFAEALAAHPKIFDRLFVNMVKAGEIGGVLDIVLARLAEFQEKAEKIKGKVKSAMTYPVVVLIMALSILTFLMLFIVPKFADIFADLMGGKGMPMLTQFVMNASETMVNRFPLVLAVVVAIVVVVKLLAKTAKGRYVLDQFKLHAPVFGQLISKNSISRFTRTLGTLMSAGVPVLQALNIVKETVGNEVISKAVATIHDAVKEGENMAPPIGVLEGLPAHGGEHGGSGRGNRRAARHADEDRRLLRRRRGQRRGRDDVDHRAAADHLPGGGGRHDRDRAVHAAGLDHRRTERLIPLFQRARRSAPCVWPAPGFGRALFLRPGQNEGLRAPGGGRYKRDNPKRMEVDMSSSELRFTPTHCWVREEGTGIVVGVTDYAQEQMSELTYVELPEVGEHVAAEAEVAVVESVKAANDVYAPVSGTVSPVNEALVEQPELVNTDPFGKGWIFKMKPDDPSDLDHLLDVDAYEAELPEEDES
jgi:glycine cleavage system H protein